MEGAGPACWLAVSLRFCLFQGGAILGVPLSPPLQVPARGQPLGLPQVLVLFLPAHLQASLPLVALQDPPQPDLDFFSLLLSISL